MRFGILAAVLFFSWALRAQEANDDSRRAAKVEFERGMALSGEGKYVDALRAFEKSRALFPTRTNTQNLALTMERLGRFTDALEMLERLRQEFPDHTPEQLDAIDKKEREIRENVGTLELVAEDGAEVEVDGRVVGTTPLARPILLNPGRHEVKLRKAGVGSATASVNIGAREVVKLEPALAPPKPARSEKPPTISKPTARTPRQPREPEPTKVHLGISSFGAWISGEAEPAVDIGEVVDGSGLGLMLDFGYGARGFFGGYLGATSFGQPLCQVSAECPALEFRFGMMAGWRWRVVEDVKAAIAAQLGGEQLEATRDDAASDSYTESYLGVHIGPAVSLDVAVGKRFYLGPSARCFLGYYPAEGEGTHLVFHLGLRGELGW